jgi:hypothetical protein
MGIELTGSGAGGASGALGPASSIAKSLHWSVLVNGDLGELAYHADTQGRVTGTLFGDQIIGLWDGGTGKVTFTRIPKSKQPDAYQFYTGYHFSWSAPDGTPREGLAGSFDAFAGSGGTYDQVTFGWYGLLHRSPPYDGSILFEDMKTPDVSGASFVNANGYRGPSSVVVQPVLEPLDAPAPKYLVKGKIFGDEVTGFAAGGRVAFVRIPPVQVTQGGGDGRKPETYQVYSGYSARLAFGNVDIHVVAGSFVSLAGSFATPQRCVYGWYGIGSG